MIDSEELGDGRLAVHIRAPIIQDLEPTDELAAHVALNCNAFHFGNLYLFSVDDKKADLDYSNKVLSTWLRGPQDLAELVTVAGDNALGVARKLQPQFGGHLANPSEEVVHTMHIGPESEGRQDVWDALNEALETQACVVMGTAEHIELARIGVLTEGWFVINSAFLWFAGRDARTRATILWRLSHNDLESDLPITTYRPTTYTARLQNGDVLTVVTRTCEAATALRNAHHDPRDLNNRWTA